MMKWLKRLWGVLLAVGAIVAGLVTMKALRGSSGRVERENGLAESVRKAELEAADKARAITVRTDEDLAEVETKRWREEKKVDDDSAAARKTFEERLSDTYSSLDDDEDTRAHLRNVLDGDGAADDGDD